MALAGQLIAFAGDGVPDGRRLNQGDSDAPQDGSVSLALERCDGETARRRAGSNDRSPRLDLGLLSLGVRC